MSCFGSDKPDIRYGLELVEVQFDSHLYIASLTFTKMTSSTFGYDIYFCICILIFGLNDDGLAHNYGNIIYWYFFNVFGAEENRVGSMQIVAESV